MSYNRIKSYAGFAAKLRTYITFPAFEISNTWRGASEIIREYHFSLTSKTSILSIFSEAPEGANFCPCIAWKPTSETIVRYKLWKGVGEILWAPDYNGENINQDFSIEIWNTDDLVMTNAAQRINLSTLIIPSDLCDDEDIELGLDFDICTDMTFDLTDFEPYNGDYYNVIGDCGITELVKGPRAFEDYLLLQCLDDLTWHKLQLVNIDDVIYTQLIDTSDTAIKPYLPLIDRGSGGEFAIRPRRVIADGETTYHLFVDGLIVDADKLGVLYLKANDNKYYGVRLFIEGWPVGELETEFARIEIDQTETIP